jgi:2-desacetyl-2-hydroxyethyl bacteriochlorophyllide A dehydrogenase
VKPNASARAGDWPSGTMPAVVISKRDEVRPEERPVPSPLASHVLVETAYVGLCGTDAGLLTGASPFIQLGYQRYPFVPGHEWSGTVVAVGDDVEELVPGQAVVGDPFITCGACRMCRRGRRNVCERRSEMGVRGPYAGAASRYARVPARVCTPLPDGLGLREAPLVEPGVTVVRGLTRTRCAFGDRVAVIGTGTLGLIAVQVARALGAEVDAVGVEPAGLELATELGARRAVTPEETDEDAYSVVVEASGARSSAPLALRLVEPAGRVALLGIANAPSEMMMPLAVLKDIECHGVLGGVEHYVRTAGLLASGAVRAEALIDRVVPAARAAEAFESLLRTGRRKPKLMLQFADAPSRDSFDSN